MSSLENALRLYDYMLPPELIAASPASPRDSAKVLVHRRKSGETISTVFREIGHYLPPRSLLILNRTKVIPARLPLARTNGGRAEVLFLGVAGELVRVLSPKRLREGEELRAGDSAFTVAGVHGKEWLLRMHESLDQLPAILRRHGHTPLPPYIKESPLSERERRREYQSVFARDPGSIAAPTASLHFTRELLASLRRDGVETASVTLHVHLGTFAPLTDEKWETGRLHTEEFSIPPRTVAAIHRAKEEGRSVIAVGTTVVRTLEGAANETGCIVRTSGETDLFIREGFPFRIVDGMITNFHVPQSSLLMLVSAFAGRETILELYRRAIAERFRFFSFGDAMLLL